MPKNFLLCSANVHDCLLGGAVFLRFVVLEQDRAIPDTSIKDNPKTVTVRAETSSTTMSTVITISKPFSVFRWDVPSNLRSTGHYRIYLVSEDFTVLSDPIFIRIDPKRARYRVKLDTLNYTERSACRLSFLISGMGTDVLSAELTVGDYSASEVPAVHTDGESISVCFEIESRHARHSHYKLLCKMSDGREHLFFEPLQVIPSAEFVPEGGCIVLGKKNRVYFRTNAHVWDIEVGTGNGEFVRAQNIVQFNTWGSFDFVFDGTESERFYVRLNRWNTVEFRPRVGRCGIRTLSDDSFEVMIADGYTDRLSVSFGGEEFPVDPEHPQFKIPQSFTYGKFTIRLLSGDELLAATKVFLNRRPSLSVGIGLNERDLSILSKEKLTHVYFSVLDAQEWSKARTIAETFERIKWSIKFDQDSLPGDKKELAELGLRPEDACIYFHDMSDMRARTINLARLKSLPKTAMCLVDAFRAGPYLYHGRANLGVISSLWLSCNVPDFLTDIDETTMSVVCHSVKRVTEPFKLKIERSSNNVVDVYHLDLMHGVYETLHTQEISMRNIGASEETFKIRYKSRRFKDSLVKSVRIFPIREVALSRRTFMLMSPRKTTVTSFLIFQKHQIVAKRRYAVDCSDMRKVISFAVRVVPRPADDLRIWYRDAVHNNIENLIVYTTVWGDISFSIELTRYMVEGGGFSYFPDCSLESSYATVLFTFLMQTMKDRIPLIRYSRVPYDRVLGILSLDIDDFSLAKYACLLSFGCEDSAVSDRCVEVTQKILDLSPEIPHLVALCTLTQKNIRGAKAPEFVNSMKRLLDMCMKAGIDNLGIQTMSLLWHILDGVGDESLLASDIETAVIEAFNTAGPIDYYTARMLKSILGEMQQDSNLLNSEEEFTLKMRLNKRQIDPTVTEERMSAEISEMIPASESSELELEIVREQLGTVFVEIFQRALPYKDRFLVASKIRVYCRTKFLNEKGRIFSRDSGELQIEVTNRGLRREHAGILVIELAESAGFRIVPSKIPEDIKWMLINKKKGKYIRIMSDCLEEDTERVFRIPVIAGTPGKYIINKSKAYCTSQPEHKFYFGPIVYSVL